MDNADEKTFFEKLCSHVKLERDNAIQEFSQMQLTSDEIRDFENKFLTILQDENSSWEAKYSCLVGLKIMIEFISVEYYQKVKPICLQLLHDKEVRVRLALGELLGAFCKRFGAESYEYFRETISDSIRNDLERVVSIASDSKEIFEKLTGFQQQTLTEEEAGTTPLVFHDTAGWHHLETSLKALHFMIDGCEKHFTQYIDGGLIDLIIKTLIHTNRFAREIGFLITASVLTCFKTICETETNSESKECSIYPEFINVDDLAALLAAGLTDSWSQVRLAACVAVRQFLMSFDSIEKREIYFPVLLAPLCLNRYYLAEGVRLHAQTTWPLVVGENGRNFVEKYIDQVVVYYVDQTKSANYTVRISSCRCIAELAQKINKDSVRPHVVLLVQTLMTRLTDQNWQVRDAACLGCEKFLISYPDELCSLLNDLLHLIFTNLSDSVPSVCSGAAESLFNIVECYGAETFSKIFPWIKDGLKKVDEEKPSTSNKSTAAGNDSSTLSSSNRLVVAQNRITFVKNEPVSNEKTCPCTLMTKVSHEGRCVFHRTPSPWETSDGCVQFTAELSASKIAVIQSKIVSELLPLIVSASQNRTYVEHVYLLETICRRIPQIAKNLKKYFKSLMDDFVEPIFYALTCECTSTETAASCCIEELLKIFGENILRAKIERINTKFLPLYEQELRKFASNLKQ